MHMLDTLSAIRVYHFYEFLHDLTAAMDQGLSVVEVPRSHLQTTQTVGLLCASDRTVADTST
jgi:hypothetical protein